MGSRFADGVLCFLLIAVLIVFISSISALTISEVYKDIAEANYLTAISQPAS